MCRRPYSKKDLTQLSWTMASPTSRISSLASSTRDKWNRKTKTTCSSLISRSQSKQQFEHFWTTQRASDSVRKCATWWFGEKTKCVMLPSTCPNFRVQKTMWIWTHKASSSSLIGLNLNSKNKSSTSVRWVRWKGSRPGKALAQWTRIVQATKCSLMVLIRALLKVILRRKFHQVVMKRI